MSPTILAEGTDLSTVMNLLLLRFGIIAICVAALAIVLFAIALTLKRKGKLGSAVKRIAPIARSYADSRNARPGRKRGGAWKNGVANALAHYLTQQAGRDDREHRP